MVMHINLHLLRIFFVVAEQQSFSRAAAALFISQPAASKAVRELERQLDLPLLERGAGGTKGMRLTESGRALFDHARGIFALERAAIEEVRARTGLQRGRLVVGASTTIAGYWLPPYLSRFLQQHPDTALDVRVGNTHEISRALIECEIDVALVEGAVADPRIEATHWQDDELRIIAPPHSALARKRRPGPALLNAETWLVREPGSGTREVSERIMQAHQIRPERRIELGSNEGIARAVAAGTGIAILPAQVVRELLATQALKIVRYPQPAEPWLRPLFMLQLKERPASPLLRAFCHALHTARPARR